MHQFLADHRDALINRCEFKATQRSEPHASHAASRYGIPVFLDQLIKTLKIEQTSAPEQSRQVSGPAGGPSEFSELGESATQHGRELSEHGFTIEQVVHDYGDLCQAITDMASELQEPVQTAEFRTLNRCLDNGIADAVTEFSHQRRLLNEDREKQTMNQRLGFLAHEIRNHLNTVSHAIGVIKSGQVEFAGATGGVLDRTLISLRSIVDHSLAEVRLTAGLPAHPQLIAISDFISSVKTSASFEAQSRGCEFSVSVVGLGLAVEADRELLFSAVLNLLQNAFKFTAHGSKVSLTAYAEDERIRIDVQDHCGGLPPGDKEDLFVPFKQRGADKSGAGLGLSICRRSVEANQGVLSVHDLPGSGCIFFLHRPASLLPELRQSSRNGAKVKGKARPGRPAPRPNSSHTRPGVQCPGVWRRPQDWPGSTPLWSPYRRGPT